MKIEEIQIWNQYVCSVCFAFDITGFILIFGFLLFTLILDQKAFNVSICFTAFDNKFANIEKEPKNNLNFLKSIHNTLIDFNSREI